MAKPAVRECQRVCIHLSPWFSCHYSQEDEYRKCVKSTLFGRASHSLPAFCGRALQLKHFLAMCVQAWFLNFLDGIKNPTSQQRFKPKHFAEVESSWLMLEPDTSIIQLKSCLLLSKQRICQLACCQLLPVFSNTTSSTFRKLSFLISHKQINYTKETQEKLSSSFAHKPLMSALWKTLCFFRFHATFLQNNLSSGWDWRKEKVTILRYS